MYIKKKKKLYGPTSLQLEPLNVVIQQVEWSGAARINGQGEEAFLPSSPSYGEEYLRYPWDIGFVAV